MLSLIGLPVKSHPLHSVERGKSCSHVIIISDHKILCRFNSKLDILQNYSFLCRVRLKRIHRHRLLFKIWHVYCWLGVSGAFSLQKVTYCKMPLCVPTVMVTLLKNISRNQKSYLVLFFHKHFYFIIFLNAPSSDNNYLHLGRR